MDKYICLHGHFYQPPRENPWTNEIDRQETAHPYHDWNERINAECYKSLGLLRVYERMSFNFGPTLLSWIRHNSPETYQAILDADKASQSRFNGHGSAMAQCYNHMIMPLANERDKQTQTVWGIRDFEFRYGRRPTGIWLPETAVDIKTLEILAHNGITFTILAPRQAAKIRKIGEALWHNVSHLHSIQTKRAYRCSLPSGKQINLFFYDGHMAQQVAFGAYSKNSALYIHGIEQEINRHFDETRLIHCAVDGETYGHHNKNGHEVLQKVLEHVEQSPHAKLINYTAYLQKYPPQYEVEIIENTAWSCENHLNRWCKDDHHSYDATTRKVHQWRAVLRDTLDWLRDQLGVVYENQMSHVCSDPWGLRDVYVDYLLTQDENPIRSRLLNGEMFLKAHKLLEMQKFAMFMFTSCGWFFEDISRIETIQILRYAARAMELAKELDGEDFKHEFVDRLQEAQSKDPDLYDGRGVYERHVQPISMTRQ